ncbi:hypothetical protein [Desulfitobacterium hafniense]|uniref:hypothetical protein n=1 Tax=Desulfitobacterium hafniense TaxID=49338 RepID=UPI000375537C|nr:hypothetical protein [Desulfitobacterium hafniense]
MAGEEYQLLIDHLNRMEAGIRSDLSKVSDRLGNLETKVSSIETRVGNIEIKVDSIETRVEYYGQEQQRDIASLLGLIDQKIDAKLDSIIEQQKSIVEVLGDHEVRLRTLNRKTG